MSPDSSASARPVPPTSGPAAGQVSDAGAGQPAAGTHAAPPGDGPKPFASRSRPGLAAVSLALHRLLSRSPLWLSHGLGNVIGALAGVWPSQSMRRACTNLRLALPELDERARRALARRSLRHTACAALEMGALWSVDRERLSSWVRAVEGEEHLQAALAGGRGVVLLSPHVGAWELVGMYLSLRHPLNAIYRPPRLRELHDTLLAGRQRFGARLVPAGFHAVRTLLGGLRRNEICAILPDQDPGRGGGVMVPFFGVPANTATLPARLIAKTNAAAVLAWAERLPRHQGYRMHFRPASPEVHDDDLERATAAINRDVEAVVRTLLPQYQWRYRRFRHGPPGHVNPYK